MNDATHITAETVDTLLGRVIDAAGRPLDQGAPVSGLDALAGQIGHEPGAPASNQQLETGIKVIDVYAPIERGGLNAIVGGSGVGKIVLTTEIMRRVIERRAGCAVAAVRSYAGYTLDDYTGELRSSGVTGACAVVGAEHTDSPEAQARAGLVALAIARALAQSGRDVILMIDESLATAQLLPQLAAGAGDGAAVTTLAWLNRQLAPGEAVHAHPLTQRASSVIVLSKELAARGIWPAIDPLRSRSALLDSTSGEHARAAAEGRELLRAHERLEASENAPAGAGPGGRARLLLRYQMQPFYVAEPFTARPGEFVALERTLKDTRALLEGRYDQRPEAEVTFIGALPE
jgi:F-type H+-transporting ATPase subunit beta